MASFLSFDDLFTAGLGFDLAGATFLGFGLLVSSRDVVRRSATVLGSNTVEAVRLSESRVDGLFGFASIGLGFACQAVAYVAVVSGVKVTTGWRSAIGAALAAFFAGLIAAALRRVFRRRLLLRLLVEVAHYDSTGMKRLSWPSRERLAGYAGVLGEKWTEEEEIAGQQSEGRGGFLFVKRIFDVDSVPETYQGEEQPPPQAFGMGPGGEPNA